MRGERYRWGYKARKMRRDVSQMGAKACHKWVPRRVTNGYVHNRHVACASCARSGTRLQKSGGLTHLRDGV